MLWSHEGDVIANDIRVHIYRTGGAKRPVVLSHGVTDSGECWPRVAPVLAREYDVITYDARGHGRTEVPKGPFTQDDQAADLKGLCEVLGLDKPALVGHSMGASTVSTAAALYPDLPACIVLEDPPWRDPQSITRAGLDSFVERVRQYHSVSTEELIVIAKKRSTLWDDAEFEGWARAKALFPEETLHLMQPTERTWREIAKAITCPALLVTGDAGTPSAAGLGAIVTPEVAAEAMTLMAHGELAQVMGAGHNIRREGFEGYIAAVTAFLHKHYPA